MTIKAGLDGDLIYVQAILSKEEQKYKSPEDPRFYIYYGKNQAEALRKLTTRCIKAGKSPCWNCRL